MRFGSRILSLALAAALELAPGLRLASTLARSPVRGGGTAATLAGWVALAAGSLASLYNGIADGIGGASTYINSPVTATGTNGAPFLYRITTAPDAATHFEAAPLPTGLSVNAATGRITGTPTEIGTFLIHLVASAPPWPERITSTNLVLTLVAPSEAGAVFVLQPVSRRTFIGSPATFAAKADGLPPLHYQWLHDGAPIPGATQPSFEITATTPFDRGRYTVVVSAPWGTLASNDAWLTVEEPARLQPSGFQAGLFRMVASGPTNADYTLLASTDMAAWLPLQTNRVTEGSWVFLAPPGPGSAHLFRVVVSLP
ncbi:MAG TPA: hypothetical protein DCM86_14485 [Verrucomicrobiales bacterium]|nr:hypothetical protein [Verrucomicrobiales bacterium]